MSVFYHYTSIDTLYNMLTKSIEKDEETNVNYLKFRATHVTALNDTMERKLFVDKLIKEVNRYLNNTLNDSEQSKLEHMCSVMDSYIISFSDSSLFDDLNMWRGYGKNGYGVCFEFDLSAISVFYKTNDFYRTENVYNLIKCEYFSPNKDIETNDFKELVRALSEFLKSAEKNTIKEACLLKKIYEKAVIYKHEAYVAEKEWRFIINIITKPEYNLVNNVIKPYVNFKIPLEAIKSIRLGPCIKDSYEVSSLVSFIKDIFGESFIVKYSDIPYRG